MTRSNCPTKRRRKDYSNTSGWYKVLANLKKDIARQQEREFPVEDEEVNIKDDDIEPNNQ